MQKFLAKTILFCTLLIGILFGLEQILNWQIRRYTDLTIESNIHYIIVGHSHPATAYQDNIIRETQNLGQPGEASFYTYWRCRAILEANPHIKGVWIEYTNDNFELIHLERTWGYSYLSSKYSELSPWLGWKDKLWLLSKNPSGIANGIASGLKLGVKKVFTNHYSNTSVMGGFTPLKKSKLEDQVKEINSRAELTLKKEYAIKNIDYIIKLANYCQEKGIPVMLIRSPLHSKYPFSYQEERVQERKGLEGIPFLDFARFPLKDNQYSDLGHLHVDGASEFSIWIDSLISIGIWENDNPEEVVKSLIQTMQE